ncbi:MAG: PQQ-binding-like beta-propeller repeat protein [Ignavibacteria bacterium]|nr:PQQ-binding-like beta-propeller repeat protein [Ignavibacteria bacterium]
MNDVRSILLVLLIPLFHQQSVCDGWNVGVGGNSARNGLSDRDGPALPLMVWNEGVTAVISQQAVIEGNTVVMARIQDLNDVLHGTVIVAQDLFTGDTLWTTELPVDFESTDWRSRVSAFRDGQVYATRAGNTNASYLYALDGTTGAQVWQSEALITETSTEGGTFVGNGDLITTGVNSVVRISAVDGSTVWETARSCPTSGGCDPVIFGERVYLWEAGGFGPVITVFDVTDGSRLFSSEGIGGGLIQQVAPFVGPDGTVYAPRTQNNAATDFLVALEDTGSGFSERWRVPLGFVPFASFGVGPDGSVYSYSREYRVIRIEPVTGAVIDSSEILVSDFYQPRMAIGAGGTIFVTNGGFSQGALYAFQPDLQRFWDPETIVNVNVGGPALGGGKFSGGGVLIVCGVGTDVRAYRYDPTSVEDDRTARPEELGLYQNYPNPFNPTTSILFRLPEGGNVSLGVYDMLGREVSVLADGFLGRGRHEVVWDGSKAASGSYIYRLTVTGADGSVTFRQSKRLLLLK